MSIENDLPLVMDFDNNYCLQVFNLLPVAFTKGKGCYLYDMDGKKYLDMIGGIAVNCLGYGHPKLSSVVAKQAKDIKFGRKIAFPISADPNSGSRLYYRAVYEGKLIAVVYPALENGTLTLRIERLYAHD